MGVSLERFEARWGTLQLYVLFEVGVDIRVKFWHDAWSGSHSLKELYPGLYACSLDWNASIHSIIDSPIGGEVHDKHEISKRNSCLRVRSKSFFHGSSTLQYSYVEGCDETIWILKGSGGFKVCSNHEAIQGAPANYLP